MNHYREALSGHGIVETAEDFGSQGDSAGHPELLDWMATEFMRDGWSTKKMLRLMVTSAAYRQSSQGARRNSRQAIPTTGCSRAARASGLRRKRFAISRSSRVVC